MGKKRKAILLASFFILIILTVSLYFRYEVFYSHGKSNKLVKFPIEKGQGNGVIASKLEEEGLIRWKIYFYYYVRAYGLLNKILPGEYELSGNMTIPEIAETITRKKDDQIKITFPEGWTSAQIAERLKENGLPGEEFLKIVKNPGPILGQYDFFNEKNERLIKPAVTSLEGYLFPDTYFFKKDEQAGNIIKKMLDNFDEKLDSKMRQDIAGRERSKSDIVTLASLIEGEVKSQDDREIVSGIFWKRLSQGMPLQSCATISYILGTKKKQYSFEDTRINSPFNTYLNKGLPPGPVNNPGLSSIHAAAYPKESPYFYFLTNPETGQTIFSKTIDEHNKNKAICGL